MAHAAADRGAKTLWTSQFNRGERRAVDPDRLTVFRIVREIRAGDDHRALIRENGQQRVREQVYRPLTRVPHQDRHDLSVRSYPRQEGQFDLDRVLAVVRWGVKAYVRVMRQQPSRDSLVDRQHTERGLKAAPGPDRDRPGDWELVIRRNHYCGVNLRTIQLLEAVSRHRP